VRRWVSILGVLLAVGCGESRPRAPGGVRPAQDAGARADAGVSGLDGGVSGLDGGPAGDAGGPEDGGLVRDGGAGPTDGGAHDAGAPDSGAPEVPYCRQTCTTRSDCVTAGSGIADDDNYACEAGECRYLGCRSDQECQDTFLSSNWVCRSFSAALAAGCVQRCAAPADCGSPAPLVDEDNYACNQGACQWIGCRTSQECVDTFQAPGWVCEPSPVPGVPNNCARVCGQAADCAQAGASAAYDVDNYACVAARCLYTGCNSTAECAMAAGRYVCR
jgi:hypothetical protein